MSAIARAEHVDARTPAGAGAGRARRDVIRRPGRDALDLPFPSARAARSLRPVPSRGLSGARVATTHVLSGNASGRMLAGSARRGRWRYPGVAPPTQSPFCRREGSSFGTGRGGRLRQTNPWCPRFAGTAAGTIVLAPEGVPAQRSPVRPCEPFQRPPVIGVAAPPPTSGVRVIATACREPRAGRRQRVREV